MIRSPMKPGTKPLKRTAFVSKPSASGKPAPRAKMKSRGPKMTPIRKAARGQDCTLRIPGVCNGDRDTTVLAHSNRAEDGKGMGIKARDEEGCFSCASCHTWIDGGYAGHMPRSLVDKYFDLARTESQAILKRKGLIK